VGINVTVCEALVAEFAQGTNMATNDLEAMPRFGHLQSGQIVTVLARLWGVDMLRKNRDKGVFRK